MAGTAHADLFELRWAAEGYYRSRAVYLTNLARQDQRIGTDPVTGENFIVPEIRRTSYLTHRLRLAPAVSFGPAGGAPLASLRFQIDAVDDVLWGDNNGIASAPLFATDASNQYFLGGLDGQEQGFVKLNKAWVQFNVPIGAMRVGRMPSHWGLGLLANGGGTTELDATAVPPPGTPIRKSSDAFFDDDFGDNHFGSVADRILFLTKPGLVYKGIVKDTSKGAIDNLIVGYAFDVLSEAPFLPAEPFERRFRPFGQQGFISRGADDVIEHVAFAVYNDPYWNPGGPLARFTDELRIGFYGVLRDAERSSTEPSDPDLGDPAATCGMLDGQPVPCIDTGSKVWIADLWWKLRYGPLYTEGELIKIGGESFGGIQFPATNEKKEADITGGVLRLGYFGTDAVNRDLWSVIAEAGHASGDDVLEDGVFKQRALHPDYNVGLILYEEILRELSARTYGIPFFSEENPEGAKGFFSDGGVINSNYVSLKGSYNIPFADQAFRLVGMVLAAWVDEPATGVAMFAEGDGKFLGTEIDLALKAQFSGAMRLSLEGGYLIFGEALKSVFPNADSSLTLQSRLAFVF